MHEQLKDEQVTLKESVELKGAGPQSTSEQFPVVAKNYQIVGLIGHGGMGTVYKAINVSTGSTVAIKTLTAAVSKDKATLKRFEQEADALADLNDPELLTIYESGMSPDGAPYLVMEYIDGDNLAEILTKGKIGNTRAFSLFIQLCDLLSRAHRHGIIHRDIKPSNIIVTKTNAEFEDNEKADFERVRVVDFGIARIVDSVRGDTTKLTQTGAVFGTPVYMSPEQCQAKQSVDQRSDIYSLGCVMYEVLTGHPPFSGDNPIQVAMQHVNDLPKPFTVKDCPKNLERVVLQCLAKDPKDRYQSVEKLREDLELVRKNHNPKHLKKLKVGKKRPDLSIGIFLFLLAALVIGFSSKAPFKEQYLRIQPSSAGMVTLKSVNAQSELRQLSAEIKLHPQDKFWYMKRAQAYENMNRDNEAIADYTKVIEIDPQDVHAYTNRGCDYMTLGQLDLAMRDVDIALILSPNHVNAICTRASIFLKKEDYSHCLIECEKAIRLDPDRINPHITTGQVYMRLKRFDKALKEFNLVIRHMEPSGYQNRSLCYLEMKQYDRSLEDATKAIDLEPSNPSQYCTRAKIYIDQKQWANALKDINKALEINPNDSEALTFRADCYAGKEQYNLAILDYTKAIALTPTDTHSYESRAYAYSSSKAYDLAIADCNRALQLDKNSKYAKELRDWCSKYNNVQTQ